MRMRKTLISGLLATGMALAFASPGYSAAYLKLGDIKGDMVGAAPSGDKHKGENDILSWSWGETNATAAARHKDWIIIESMSSPLVAKTAPADLKGSGVVSVARELDKSSTKLQEACANGTMIDEVEITLRVENKQEPYLTYKLKDVLVTSYTIRNPRDSDDRPTEEVAFYYNKIAIGYGQTDDAAKPARATLKPMRAKPASDRNTTRTNR